jgi:putative holliday junction resolvase
MGKIIALDFGLKRTGLAITDESQSFAFGLTTVDSKELDAALKKLVFEENIDEIVIGEPKRLDLSNSHITENVHLLKSFLEKTFPTISIVLYDERFTSKMASASISQLGLKKSKREKKEIIDQVSATILLQDYLSYKNNLLF